jgi:hypothetical protein
MRAVGANGVGFAVILGAGYLPCIKAPAACADTLVPFLEENSDV